MSEVTLKGGPFAGAKVPRATGSPLVVNGDGVPEGMVARYRRKRGDNDHLHFDGWDRVIATLPLPGAGS